MNISSGFMEGINDCYSITGCISTTIFNTWQKSFFGFVENLFHYVYNVAIDEWVLNYAVVLFFLMLFLSFVVGFIFFVRR